MVFRTSSWGEGGASHRPRSCIFIPAFDSGGQEETQAAVRGRRRVTSGGGGPEGRQDSAGSLHGFDLWLSEETQLWTLAMASLLRTHTDRLRWTSSRARNSLSSCKTKVLLFKRTARIIIISISSNFAVYQQSHTWWLLDGLLLDWLTVHGPQWMNLTFVDPLPNPSFTATIVLFLKCYVKIHFSLFNFWFKLELSYQRSKQVNSESDQRFDADFQYLVSSFHLNLFSSFIVLWGCTSSVNDPVTSPSALHPRLTFYSASLVLVW